VNNCPESADLEYDTLNITLKARNRMTNFFPLMFAAVVGFAHAFEIDHLLAVSNIVTQRRTIWEALRDGIYWGLGHTSTIMVIGILMILAKVGISEGAFHYFEACVGFMLMFLGAHRIWKTWESEKEHLLMHARQQEHDHRLAFGVGLVHGLAGSGALVLLVMTEIHETLPAIIYLLIFGAGSIAGMMLASGLFSLPFSKKIAYGSPWRWRLTLLSSLLCIFFGVRVIWENLGVMK
jgi:cytochrome c biogenesis protein CcdA